MAFVSSLPFNSAPCTSSSPSSIPRRSSSSITQRLVPRRCRFRATATNDAAASAANPASRVSDKRSSDDHAPPPSTFFQAITQAQDAVTSALQSGERLLEIEFPPLPTSVLESSSVSAYDVSDANLRLAVDFARRFANNRVRTVIAFPDLIEKDRAVQQNNESEEPVENIRFGSLRDAKKGSIIERIWTKADIDIAVRPDDDMFIVLGASAQELPDVEKLVEAAGERPVVLFNLKLDTARGDLGLPAFPRKDLHYRFLSKVLPVYYLRTRTYSRSMNKPPFVVNYSGALYRVYPGKYQVLLDTAAGNYRRLSTLDERPPLGQVRDVLTDGLNLENVKGQSSKFLFKGYKSTTWWEDDRTKQVSNKWRS